jgi:aspartyl-tRNA(Asn)/glutamyl-tRNA(Gln) amidotransferase subunit B
VSVNAEPNGPPAAHAGATRSASGGRLIVGMEVHLQLKTVTKCFCPCRAVYGAEPNVHVCPVCLGLPGALPVLDREGLRGGLALGCSIAARTKWDRKNYYYPDLPKGYQISQYDVPLCFEGGIAIDGDDGKPKVVRIRRAHLEEDTGKSFHVAGTPVSRIDLNRCGTPLLEIVSEPDLASAEEAGRYLDELRRIVAYAGVSDGNMQEGNLRCEPNVNLVFQNGDRTPIVEVKNVNSVGGVERAIRFETARQDAEYRTKGATSKNTPRSTRGWDDPKGETVHQRFKESADDYRYFPEPDVPPVDVDPALVAAERASLPELPRARRTRYVEAFGLSAYDASVLTADRAVSDWYEAALRPGASPKTVANLLMGEVFARLKELDRGIEAVPFPPSRLGELASLLDAKTINGGTAKQVLRTVWETGEAPAAIVEKAGLAQVSDPAAVRSACEKAIADAPQAADAVRGGNEKAIGKLVGLAMKALGGKGDPVRVNETLKTLLSG